MFKTKYDIEQIFGCLCAFGHIVNEFIINDDLSVSIYGDFDDNIKTSLINSGIFIKHYNPDTTEYKIFKTIKALKK